MKAYVTADGEYGMGVLTFDEEALSVDQWEDLTEMYPGDRYEYVEAILSGDTKTATRLLEESGLRQSSV